MRERLELQNGTDIRGIALSNPEKPINLDEAATAQIACGYLQWLSKRSGKSLKDLRISVGTDSRISGDSLKTALIETFMQSGASVYDMGLATTPAIFMSTVMEEYSADGGVMITASHLPYFYNGFKFFTKDGGLEKADITEILTAETVFLQENKGEVFQRNLIQDYSLDMVNFIRMETGEEKPLKDLKIIVDAGNGAGGFFADEVLAPLGADTTGSLFLEPDGYFPNHIPNPENKEAMKIISQAVRKTQADLGIIFDTDVDRAAVVSADGREINRNDLIALLSAIVLQEYPNSIIVTDSVTSTGLSEFIERQGGIHHRFKRGYRNIINEGIRFNREGKYCYLAMETSGHGAMKENYFLDDGAYLVAKILVYVAKLNKEGKKITSLIEDLKQPAQAKEYRIPIKTENYKEDGQKVLSDLEKWIVQMPEYSLPDSNYEGVKGTLGRNWFLLRMSLHEPLLPLNLESEEIGGIEPMLEELKKFLAQYDFLDIRSLQE